MTHTTKNQTPQNECIERGIEPSGDDAMDEFVARSSDINECEDCQALPGEECCSAHSD